MKKIIFATVLVLTIGLSASAQDGFFRGGDNDGADRAAGISGTTPLLPGQGVGATNNDQSGVPLSSGLLILTALGAGYALNKRNEK